MRYYTRIGLLEPRRHPDNGYKLFSYADIRRLSFIRKAQSLGYTMEEIRHFFALRDKGYAPCTEVRAFLKQRLAANRERVNELIALQQRMRRALHLWEQLPGEPGSTGEVCNPIERAEGDEEGA